MIPSKEKLLELDKSTKDSDRLTGDDIQTIYSYSKNTIKRNLLFYSLGYYRALNSLQGDDGNGLIVLKGDKIKFVIELKELENK